MDISKKLKDRRKELDLTMLEVANRTGVSEATVSRWESGDIANMRRDKIVLLANALEVSPSFIMGWSEKSEKKNDIISNIVLRLRSDDDFLDISKTIYDMSQEELTAVKNFLSVFKK